jgi:hypothetical protein
MDDSVNSYQWGYENDVLEGETAQFLFDPGLQYTNLFNYWVITTFTNGCSSTSYYDGQAQPLKVSNSPDISITVSPNPNQGDCKILIEHLILDKNTLLSIHKYSGEIVKVFSIPFGFSSTERHLSGLDEGVYIIKVMQLGRLAIAKMIVNKN